MSQPQGSSDQVRPGAGFCPWQQQLSDMPQLAGFIWPVTVAAIPTTGVSINASVIQTATARVIVVRIPIDPRFPNIRLLSATDEKIIMSG